MVSRQRQLASVAHLVFTSVVVLLVFTWGCVEGDILDPAQEVDDETLAAPDVADDPPPEEPVIYDYLGGSEKFNAAGSKWLTTDLTWCVQNSTPDLTDAQVRSAIAGAWAEWSRISTLTFQYTDRCDRANFVIRFAEGAHGDTDAFDGAGGVLAHATFPRYGTIHFDDAEKWTTEQRPHGGGAKDLQTVALHEFGHSLGLRHSDVESAVMYAYYGGSLRTLRTDDVDGVRSIYGDPGTAVDVDDHGDERRTATKMDGATVDGEIEVGGDVDYFAFDVDRVGMWTLSTAGSTDTVCTLYDADGVLIAENDDAPGSRNCRIEMELNPARYYVRVRHYDPSRSGRYVLSVAGVPTVTEPTVPDQPTVPDRPSAPDLPEEPACPVGEPCNPIDVGHFPFSDSRDTRRATSDAFDRYSCAPSTNESGGEYVYQVRLQQRGTLDVAVNDVRGDGTDIDVHLLGAMDPNACIARHNAQVRAVLDPGVYVVVIDTWVSGSGTAYPGAYTVTMTFVPTSNLEVEHGDTFEDASVIDTEATIDAAVDRVGDSDIFRFTPSVDATYAIRTTGAVDTVCQLFDQSLHLEAESLGGGAATCDLRAALSAGVTYMLRVRPANPDATGPYTLAVGRADADAEVDVDQDGVADDLDLCSDTPRGAQVWPSGDWAGCAPGQVRD